MFGSSNNKLMQMMLQSQLKKLKKVKVEMSSDTGKTIYRIKEHDIQPGLAVLILEDTQSHNKAELKFHL